MAERTSTCNPHIASHKSNPSSALRSIMDSYSTLGHVGGGNSCGGYTLMGVAMTHWLTGLWSTPAKKEGIMPKAAWHWGRDSSVINKCLGEPGCNPLYVAHPSAWGSVDGDLMFFSICRRASFWGLWQTCMKEWINRPVALVTEYPCPWGPC